MTRQWNLWMNEHFYIWRLTFSTYNNVCLRRQVPPKVKNAKTLGIYSTHIFSPPPPPRTETMAYITIYTYLREGSGKNHLYKSTILHEYTHTHTHTLSLSLSHTHTCISLSHTHTHKYTSNEPTPTISWEGFQSQLNESLQRFWRTEWNYFSSCLQTRHPREREQHTWRLADHIMLS